MAPTSLLQQRSGWALLPCPSTLVDGPAPPDLLSPASYQPHATRLKLTSLDGVWKRGTLLEGLHLLLNSGKRAEIVTLYSSGGLLAHRATGIGSYRGSYPLPRSAPSKARRHRICATVDIPGSSI
jgi:hypothetical protein